MVPGDTTRPIRDQVKEALFNILGHGVSGNEFLDLFAGTGSVGIEALSRGAAQATFVERHSKAISTIRQNLELTRFADRGEVIQSDVFEWLKGGGRSYDFVYIAPPQYSELWSKVVRQLDLAIDRLNPDAWVIAQLHPSEARPMDLERLVEFDRRTYGKTLLIFYERPGT